MHRISSQFNNTNTQGSLRRQEVKQATMNRQIGTQSKIGSLRDDPIAAGHLVRYQSYLTRVNQFEKNARTLSDQLQIREGYVNQNLQIMQRVRELAVQGANGTYTKEDLANMSTEVNELLKELVQNANAIGPDGNTLFAGTKTKGSAFDVIMSNVPGASGPVISEVLYKGNVTSNKIEVDENAYMELKNNGNSIFWAEPQTLNGQRDLSNWTSLQDSVISVDGVDVKIKAGDNVYAVAAKINESGASIKASVDPITNGLNLVTTDSHQVWLEDKNGSVLESMGFIKDRSQQPPYNIGESVRVAGGSLFDSVIAFRDALLRGDQESIGGRVLGTLDLAVSNLTSKLSENGSNYERAQNNIVRSSNNSLMATQLVSNEGDVDITKAITDLKMLEYVNQATLSTAGKMYSSSLLNYMQ